MIKLVVCDMDGTMMGRDEVIPAGAAEWIAGLEARGILFTVATGRAEGYMREKVARMGLRHPYIVTNGATIMDKGRAVLRRQFAIRPLRELIGTCYGLGMSVLFTFQGEERTENITPWIIREGEKRNRPYEAKPLSGREWEELRADKLLIMDPVREGKILEIEEKLRAIPGDFMYVRYRLKALELNEKAANKAAALKVLARHLGISMEEVLVIGDDDNDIQLFQTAGHSAAVGNVSDNARPYAEYVCQGQEFQGVMEAVEKFCGGK